MHTVDKDARKSLLDGRCGISVSPKTATLSPGQQQQFTVSAPSDVTVTWWASCGAIDQNGLYTATDTGTCTVKAQSNTDPNVFDTATVTIPAGFPIDVDFEVSIEASNPNTHAVEVPFQKDEYESDDLHDFGDKPPFNLVGNGTFQPTGLAPANYSLSATAASPPPAPLFSGGTFSSTVDCSASGSQITGPDGNPIGAISPEMTARADVSINSSDFEIPPGGITLSISGSISAGATKGSSFAGSLFDGSVDIDWTSNGVENAQRFSINDGPTVGDSGPTSANINPGSIRILPPGSFNVFFDLNAGCKPRADSPGAAANGGSDFQQTEC